MSISTVPAAKDAILDLIAARTALNGTQQAWAIPGTNELEKECIYIGDVEHAQKWAALGGRARSEDYVVQVVVYVHQDGNDARTCEERMWVLVGEIEQALRPGAPAVTLNSTVMTAEWQGGTAKNYPGDASRTAEYIGRVHCTARI